jgi:hypothetical protein
MAPIIDRPVYSVKWGGSLADGAELAAGIYQLIVSEIPVLRGDTRVLTLLEASGTENVSTLLHILRHGIDLEHVRAPAAAEEYARRLAQRGVMPRAFGSGQDLLPMKA